MSHFSQHGSRFMVARDADSIIHDVLPAHTYTVEFNEQQGFFFLSQIDNFSLPSKIYGDSDKVAQRVLDTFWKRPAGTGVHLDGVKGSGKTLLAKNICVRGQGMELPVITVNKPFHGEQFNTMIQSIGPAIIVFDEFEKTYDYEIQTKILTLFDGVFPSKKLFLITTNDSYRVSSFLKNRPGRMYYSLTYDVMDIEMVREYLADNLKNQTHRESIIKYAQVFTFLNFDMLVAIVEEMNRYNETLADVLKMLNVKPEMKADEKYKVLIQVNKLPTVELEVMSGFDPNSFHKWLSKSDIETGYGIDVLFDEEDENEVRDKKIFEQLARSHGNRAEYVGSDDELHRALEEAEVVGENNRRTVVSNVNDGEYVVEILAEHLVGFDSSKNQFRFERKYRGATIAIIVEREPIHMQTGLEKFSAF